MALTLESYLAIHSCVGDWVSVAARDFLHHSECTEKSTYIIAAVLQGTGVVKVEQEGFLLVSLHLIRYHNTDTGVNQLKPEVHPARWLPTNWSRMFLAKQGPVVQHCTLYSGRTGSGQCQLSRWRINSSPLYSNSGNGYCTIVQYLENPCLEL